MFSTQLQTWSGILSKHMSRDKIQIMMENDSRLMLLSRKHTHLNIQNSAGDGTGQLLFNPSSNASGSGGNIHCVSTCASRHICLFSVKYRLHGSSHLPSSFDCANRVLPVLDHSHPLPHTPVCLPSLALFYLWENIPGSVTWRQAVTLHPAVEVRRPDCVSL